MKINIHNTTQKIFLTIALIISGAIGRYVLYGLGTQPFPNFEIIMVLTFVAVILLKSNIALLVPLLSMIISDILIGNPIFVGNQMNKIVLFTYSGFALISVVTLLFKEKIRPYVTHLRISNFAIAAGLGIGFVLLYDIWTNFGWWYIIYPHTAETFATVYIAGIPFMIYHLLSGIITFTLIGVPLITFINSPKEETKKQPLHIPHTFPAMIITIIVIALAFHGTATQIPRHSEVWLEHTDATSVTLIIIGDTWTLKDNLVAQVDETVFTLLQRTLDLHDYTFEYTYYQDFDAALIDTIHITKNGDGGKYWQYYINGELPMVGQIITPS
ncbi:MAG: DUF4430 domain-containing protein [Candidatus Thermoplasmatota archaeon]|nr:DUF4430 domain-containing protein [Candidatus Thermoplasmatota archaeon]